MPQRIDVPGMGIVEFPDGMSDADITKAIQRNMPAPEAPKAETPGVGMSMLIGAGRGTDKLVQGVRQGFNWLTGDQKTLDKMAADEAEKDRLYKPLQQAHPVATALGETAPALGAGVLTGGTTVLGGAAAGALPSLLSYGTPEERLKRGAVDAVGGGAGVALGKGVARILKPAGVGTEGASSAAMEAAQRIGYKPTPAQISGNPAAANFENYLLRTPGSSGTMQKVAAANQQALNRAGAEAVGQTADTLDEAVLGAAKKTIGNEFDRLQAITKPQLGDDFINALSKIEADNAARGSFRGKHIDHVINKGLDLAAKGDLDGKAYKEIRSALTNEALMMSKMGDETTAGAYREVRSALDRAAKESLSEADKKAWDVVRKQWDDFKTITKSNVAEAGNVSAPRAASALRSKHPEFRTGGVNGPLADVARVGEAFKSVPNPNSGNLMNQMMFSNPLTGLPMLAANKAMAAAYMSPAGQRYFSRGLLDVGQTGQDLLSRAGTQLTIPYGRSLLGVE